MKEIGTVHGNSMIFQILKYIPHSVLRSLYWSLYPGTVMFYILWNALPIFAMWFANGNDPYLKSAIAVAVILMSGHIALLFGVFPVVILLGIGCVIKPSSKPNENNCGKDLIWRRLTAQYIGPQTSLVPIESLKGFDFKKASKELMDLIVPTNAKESSPTVIEKNPQQIVKLMASWSGPTILEMEEWDKDWDKIYRILDRHFAPETQPIGEWLMSFFATCSLALYANWHFFHSVFVYALALFGLIFTSSLTMLLGFTIQASELKSPEEEQALSIINALKKNKTDVAPSTRE